MNIARSLAPLLVLATSLALTSLAAGAAETAPPGALNGTVQSLDGQRLKLRTTEMQDVIVVLAPTTRIVNTVAAKLTDIRNGDFIGTTAETRGSRLVATEVHVFAEALRGTGEGHYPWTQPNTTMTNGAVATMTNGVAQKDGASLTVAYKGGQQQVQVPATTPVTRLDIATTAVLKAGARVTVFGAKPQTDGSVSADMLLLPLRTAR